ECLTDEMWRIKYQKRCQSNRKNADRNVVEENPSPTVIVGDPAAEHGADDGSYHNSHSIKSHSSALLFFREAFDQDCLRDRLERASAESLQDAEENEQSERRRNAAQ